MHKIFRELCELGLAKEGAYDLLHDGVRDHPNLKVYRCRHSGVIFLSELTASSLGKTEGLEYWQQWWNKDKFSTSESSPPVVEDDLRRSRQFLSWIAGKKWVDIGTGLGGILDLLAKQCTSCMAVEPQSGALAFLKKRGYRVKPQISDLCDDDFEVATLFHVFEHFVDPLAELRALHTKMRKGGTLIIEIPHAGDALISMYQNEAFLNFTFRSDHLILHTRESLKRFVESTGFRIVTIEGFQRYALANHLFWLAKGRAGGHLKWPQIDTPALVDAYGAMLAKLDMTDTLIAIAVKE